MGGGGGIFLAVYLNSPFYKGKKYWLPCMFLSIFLLVSVFLFHIPHITIRMSSPYRSPFMSFLEMAMCMYDFTFREMKKFYPKRNVFRKYCSIHKEHFFHYKSFGGNICITNRTHPSNEREKTKYFMYSFSYGIYM